MPYQSKLICVCSGSLKTFSLYSIALSFLALRVSGS